MPRTGGVKRRVITPDPIYNSALVTRLINRTLSRGKRSTAKKIVYGALSKLDADHQKAAEALSKAIGNIKPLQEVRSRRVGGATYQVPMPVSQDRSEALAIRWLIEAAKSRKGVPMAQKLSAELKDALNNQGAAVKKRENTHKMAEANKAFAHFRW